ncbi:putative UspA domain protein [Acidobacteriia bacterium SbA2]|nr:putative UspA domain protein [Acidobacteriia bacterium SbA2]
MFAAKVTLLYVLAPSMSGFELLARPAPDAEEDRNKSARATLESYLVSAFPRRDTLRLLAKGEAAAEIARIAREEAFELIVMPTHAGVFRRMLLGSTAAKVLNDADSLVLTTQHAETKAPRPLEHREIACAVGLGADSERVLRCATEVAEKLHANLSIIHAIPAIDRGLPIQLDLEESARSMASQAAPDRIAEMQRVLGSRARVHIVAGPIKDAVTEAASRLQADILVVGRSAQPGERERFRDLTYALVRDAPCPVLSV